MLCSRKASAWGDGIRYASRLALFGTPTVAGTCDHRWWLIHIITCSGDITRET